MVACPISHPAGSAIGSRFTAADSGSPRPVVVNRIPLLDKPAVAPEDKQVVPELTLSAFQPAAGLLRVMVTLCEAVNRE